MQRRQELVRRAEAPAPKLGWQDRIDCFEFLGRVGAKVRLGRLDARVAEPQSDLLSEMAPRKLFGLNLVKRRSTWVPLNARAMARASADLAVPGGP